MTRFFNSLLVGVLVVLASCHSPQDDADLVVHTKEGDIYIKLYEDTPLHRENILRRARAEYFKGRPFFRVIPDFVIQGGGPTLDTTEKDLDANFVKSEASRRHFHKRGAVGAARMGDPENPRRLSSATQFYIVTGAKFLPEELDKIEQENDLVERRHFADIFARRSENEWLRNLDYERVKKERPQLIDSMNRVIKEAYLREQGRFAFDPTQRKAYTEAGGAPSLDAGYTVFGEVVAGMDVAEKIGKGVTRFNSTRPLEPVVFSVEVLRDK